MFQTTTCLPTTLHSSTTIRSTPTSTLFPYTTLFRSRSPRSSAPAPSPRWSGCAPPAAGCCWTSGVRGDRKSTRLNSSHVEISYAVFCLKKKKHPIARHFLHLFLALYTKLSIFYYVLH